MARTKEVARLTTGTPAPRKILETSKGKRKLSKKKEKVTDPKKYGNDLVGARIKVWWAEYDKFYKGVVYSFNSKTGEHMVVYDHGDDNEHLNLEDETWELVEDDNSMKDRDQGTRTRSPDTSPAMFHKGVVESFKLKIKKHKVTDAHGNLEVLNRGDKKFILIQDNDSVEEGDQETRAVSPDTSSKMGNGKSSQDGGEGSSQPLSATLNPCLESPSKRFCQQKYICNMWEILIGKLSKCRLEDLTSFEKVANTILKVMEETTTINLSFLRTVVHDFFVKVREYDQQRLLSLEMRFMEFPVQTFKEKNEQLETILSDESHCKTKVADFKQRLAVIETELFRLNTEKDEVLVLLAKEEDKISKAQSTIASLSMDLSNLEDHCIQSYKPESDLEKLSKFLEIRLKELMNLKPFT